MAKKHPEPFWRKQTNCFYVQIGKKQVRLATDEAEAWRLYHELMARPSEQAESTAPSPSQGMLVVEVLDTFLGWVKGNKADRTFEWYTENLQRFAKRIDPDFKVTDLKPYHATRAMEDFPDWSNNTKANFVGALKRAFNWAADEELIERSPLTRMKKASREVREMAVSPEEYARVVATIKEPRFRELIELSWETGARVQELRKEDRGPVPRHGERPDRLPAQAGERQKIPPGDLPDRSGKGDPGRAGRLLPQGPDPTQLRRQALDEGCDQLRLLSPAARPRTQGDGRIRRRRGEASSFQEGWDRGS